MSTPEIHVIPVLIHEHKLISHSALSQSINNCWGVSPHSSPYCYRDIPCYSVISLPGPKLLWLWVSLWEELQSDVVSNKHRQLKKISNGSCYDRDKPVRGDNIGPQWTSCLGWLYAASCVSLSHANLSKAQIRTGVWLIVKGLMLFEWWKEGENFYNV